MAVRAIDLLKQTFNEFLEDECPRMAAALSYYTFFSLPPLLILILLLLGAVVDPQEVRGEVETQFGGLIGPAGAEQIHTILENAQQPDVRRPLALVLGLSALIFGATGAFAELQAALNRAWEVQPDPAKGGIKNFFVKRVFSFGMVLGIAFLLLVSLSLSAILTAFGGALTGFLPGTLSEPGLQLFNFGVSFMVITLLFAAMYHILPDARISWRDAFIGGLGTALLFVIGKTLIGLYLGGTNPGDAYGAAGSLAIVLVWVYYTSMILLLGAEFTQAWAEQNGRGIEPDAGAVRIVKETKRLEEGPDPEA